MKTFKLSGEVTISVYTVVQAETLEEAEEIALQRNIEAHNWGDNRQQYDSWISCEYDGEVCNVKEE